MKRQAVLSHIMVVALTCFLPGCVGFGFSGPSIFDVLADVCLVNGCFVAPCVVDPILVKVDEAASPMVPDQEVSGCFQASIIRTFENDAEREMIQIAENLASTVGPSWISSTKTPGSVDANGEPLFLIADAATSESLSYYANRVLSFQTALTPQTTRAYLTYTARLVDYPIGPASGDSTHGPIVRLELNYFEQPPGGVGGSGPSAWREVEFDQSGNVVEIRGDGETVVIVS